MILGSGWAAHSLIKVLDLSLVSNVTLISPRNYFFFTPLLSATAVGTVEFRSIVDPVRKANPYVQYFEATAESIQHREKYIWCRREGGDLFKVEYDVLVVAVGESVATFGVEGSEWMCFLKELNDARKLRRKLLDAMERAALPVWTEQQRRDLLHFVVVGGGPTGKFSFERY